MSRANPQPQASPWTWWAADYQNNAIRVAVAFNTSTKALQNATVTRDPGCVYKRMLFGLGPDGTPDTTPTQFEVPDGTTVVSRQELSRVGLNNIDDVMSVQVTAGF